MFTDIVDHIFRLHHFVFYNMSRVDGESFRLVLRVHGDNLLDIGVNNCEVLHVPGYGRTPEIFPGFEDVPIPAVYRGMETTEELIVESLRLDRVVHLSEHPEDTDYESEYVIIPKDGHYAIAIVCDGVWTGTADAAFTDEHESWPTTIAEAVNDAYEAVAAAYEAVAKPTL